MSNNAVAAYEEGKKPLSKWSKSKILDSLCVSEEEKEKLKKYCLDTLRQYFLRYSEWHHTSSHYNCTDFYEVVVPDRIDYKTLDASEAFYRECIQVQKIKKAEAKKQKKAFCKWVNWEGTRSHPKAVHKKGYCIISGNFAYTEYKEKKRTDGKYFRIVEVFPKAPRGTAKIFDEIKRFNKLKGC